MRLHHEPNVLVVFNHPMWDLYLVGKEKHQFLVNEFLQKNGAYLHALELNGLRNWDENRAVRRLAEKWNMLLIAGGDRHGVEPNANINLTNAASFTEFVHEVRVPGRATCSSCRNMPSLGSIASCNQPSTPCATTPSSRRVRAHGTTVSFIPTQNGVIRPLSEIWPKGSAPRSMSAVIAMVQLMGQGLVAGGLRMAWSESHQLRLALGEPEF